MELRCTDPTSPSVTPQAQLAAPRPRAEGSGAFASPLPSMLELSAATRAVAAEPLLRPAVVVLQREACRLTGSQYATVVTFDWARRTAWTLEGLVISDELRELVVRVAGRGRREVFDHALVEPIGTARSRAVLALWRTQAAPFGDDDITLVAALAGGVAATLHRLLGAR